MKYKVRISKAASDWYVDETLYEDDTCRVINMRRTYYAPTYPDALNHALNLVDHVQHLYLQAVLEKHNELINKP